MFQPSRILRLRKALCAIAKSRLLALRSLLAGAAGPLTGHLSDVYTGRWPVIAGSLVLGMAGFGLLSCAKSPRAILLGVALGAISGGAALGPAGRLSGSPRRSACRAVAAGYNMAALGAADERESRHPARPGRFWRVE
ncbi:MAG: hypothetical protein U9R15_01220 [Chloroflexota bacterium]|nr:hypothetical protein [Chloroflexota bacterium]